MSFCLTTFCLRQNKRYGIPIKALIQAESQRKKSFCLTTFCLKPVKACNIAALQAFVFCPLCPPIGGKRGGQKSALSPVSYGATKSRKRHPAGKKK